MLFVELTPFQTFRADTWSDEEYRGLQNFLLKQPNAGDTMRGCGGLRKLRWSTASQGKRGAARVIYYWFDRKDVLVFLFGYLKNVQEDLTPAQLKKLTVLMKDFEP